MSIYAGNKKIAGLYRGEDVTHATEEHAGIIEIATSEEVQTGEDNLKAVTPLKLKEIVDAKQDVLISGTNIKTINGEDILGEGDIEIQGGGGNQIHYIEQGYNTPWVISDAEPGIYILSGSTTWYYKVGTSSTSFYSLSPLNREIIIYKKFTECTANEYFGKFVGVDGTDYKIYKSSDRAISFAQNPGINLSGYAKTASANTFTQKNTFNVLPESSAEPTTENQLINKKYVDGLIGDLDTLLQDLDSGSGV